MRDVSEPVEILIVLVPLTLAFPWLTSRDWMLPASDPGCSSAWRR